MIFFEIRLNYICVVIVLILIRNNELSCTAKSFMSKDSDDIKCLNIEDNDDLPPIDGNNATFPGKTIFFIETSCKAGIDIIQACSIESAARSNPGWQINVLFTGPVSLNSFNTGTLDKLKGLTNVKFLRVHLTKYSEGTPLECLITSGRLHQSLFAVHHTSDILRYLTLYKYGGVYLDLDMIVVKSFDSLPRNWAAMEAFGTLAAGALAFSYDKVGRGVAEAAVEELRSTFKPHVWSYNSVGVISRVLQRFCLTSNVMQMSSATCHGFEVFRMKYFYPIYHSKWHYYFNQPIKFKPGAAYTHHLWNAMSQRAVVAKGSLLAQLAKQFCPTIYQAYKRGFGS